MKPKQAAVMPFVLATLALAGCSTNPSVPGGASISDFARGLDGKKYSFDLSGSIQVPGMSGVLTPGQRIPRGLVVALEPARAHCMRDGGESSFTKLQTFGEAQLPLRMLCRRGDALLWALDIAYQDLSKTTEADAAGRKTLLFLNMTTRTQLLSADQTTTQLREERAQTQSREQAAATDRERQAALVRYRQDLDKANAVEAQRVAAQWPARVAEFRAHLKPGDRFRWAAPPSTAWGGPFVGMVVRVEGALAFVQFDNLTFAGQPTRYIARDQLEPFDGPTPRETYEIM